MSETAMETTPLCPYCGGRTESYTSDPFEPDRYHCVDCDRLFDDDDIRREGLRHRLSALLSAHYATEENPLPFEHPIGEWDDESVGLSSLDLPWCNGVFECQDGTIWFNIDGTTEPMDFDDICTHDLQDILHDLEEDVRGWEAASESY